MKLRSLIGASCLAAALVLTGCSSAPASPQEASHEPTETIKEAGVSGSRICFLNSTGLTISAAPAGQAIAGSQDIGPAGPVLSNKELCFAGWNSRRYTDWVENEFDKGYFNDYTTDVIVAVSIDGAYNAVTIRANNPAIARPDLTWTEDPLRAQKWSGQAMSDGAVVQGSASGHSFTITRRGDTDNYKEFLIQFTQ